MIPRSRRSAGSFAGCFILLICIFLLQGVPHSLERHQSRITPTTTTGTPGLGASASRKLLTASPSPSASPWDSSARIGGWGCSADDVEIYQAATSPLPDGIPSYEVHVINACLDASVSQVHVRCGWFSSVRLVNPQVFRRIAYDDCLLNDGDPVGPGQEMGFQYANSFPYPLSIASVECQQPPGNDASGRLASSIESVEESSRPPPPG